MEECSKIVVLQPPDSAHLVDNELAIKQTENSSSCEFGAYIKTSDEGVILGLIVRRVANARRIPEELVVGALVKNKDRDGSGAGIATTPAVGNELDPAHVTVRIACTYQD